MELHSVARCCKNGNELSCFMRHFKLRNELINSHLWKRTCGILTWLKLLKRPAFEADFCLKKNARGLMPLLLAVNNFNSVISYVLWVIIHIFSQKYKQTHLLSTVSQRNLQAACSTFTSSWSKFWWNWYKKGQRSEEKRCQNTFGFHKFNNIEDTNNG